MRGTATASLFSLVFFSVNRYDKQLNYWLFPYSFCTILLGQILSLRTSSKEIVVQSNRLKNGGNTGYVHALA